MPTIDLGQVKGDKGDPFKYEDFTAAQLAALKGAKGDTPIIKAGSATSLDATAAPTVSATTSGTTTTFNFGIPKGDTSDIKTPTFTDSVSTYTTLNAANTAAETASNAIKSKVSIFTILSNMKKSFSAIVQGLKILGTNVGAITGITSDLAGESETVAASIKAVNQLNSNLNNLPSLSVNFIHYTGIVAFDALCNNITAPCVCITSTENITDKPSGKYGVIVIFKFAANRMGAIMLCTDGAILHTAFNTNISNWNDWS